MSWQLPEKLLLKASYAAAAKFAGILPQTLNLHHRSMISQT